MTSRSGRVTFRSHRGKSQGSHVAQRLQRVGPGCGSSRRSCRVCPSTLTGQACHHLFACARVRPRRARSLIEKRESLGRDTDKALPRRGGDAEAAERAELGAGEQAKSQKTVVVFSKDGADAIGALCGTAPITEVTTELPPDALPQDTIEVDLGDKCPRLTDPIKLPSRLVNVLVPVR
jgi:hypothetical protein